MALLVASLFTLALTIPGVASDAPAVAAEHAPAPAAPSAALAPDPTDPNPVLTADRAAGLAVNRLEPTEKGLRLRHPRRQVDFTADGIRVVGRRAGADWTWRLTGVAASTGRALVEISPVAPVAVGPARVRYDRGAIREEYRLDTDGVEQLFVIPAPLALGGGDLVVAGEIHAVGEFAATTQGWRWRGPRGEATLGEASVADATGRAIPCRFEVTASRTELTVDGAALATAVYPVTIDPEIGTNDYRISDMGPDGDPDYDAFDPAVAFNSSNNTYLVVWEGDDTPGGLAEDEMEIFGQVLSGSTGSQTGYSDVRISYAGGTGDDRFDARNPAVAYNSVYNQYFVVWEADQAGGGLVDNEFEIWGQVVDANLFPLFGDNFRISSMGPDGDAAFDAYRPAVAYDPARDEYLVVWDGDDDTGALVDEEREIWAQRVYSTGILVGNNLRMSDMGGTGDPVFDAIAPDVAFNPRELEYLIVWQGDDGTAPLVDDENEIFAQLIDEDGVGVGPNDARLSDMGGVGDANFDGFAPAVAYNRIANEYLVVWLGDDNVGGLLDNEFEIFSQRLAADLGGLGSNDYRLSDAGGVGDASVQVMWGPAVAFNPAINRYLVTWSGEDTVDGMVNGEWEVFAQLLSADIQGVGPNDERISDAGGLGNSLSFVFAPVVAANPTNGQFLVAWGGEDDVDGMVDNEEEIFIQRMDGMAIFVDGFEVGDASNWSSVTP